MCWRMGRSRGPVGSGTVPLEWHSKGCALHPRKQADNGSHSPPYSHLRTSRPRYYLGWLPWWLVKVRVP